MQQSKNLQLANKATKVMSYASAILCAAYFGIRILTSLFF